ncbi:hypothetical protein FVR03_16205 [Pontibacter qinzhouensis]|uniref:Uncharacterized protein n=1 Tax=Pontibacter qinzhouensis TaxID=2603253 RepID=A0A5C8JFD5_9BACT|nr:hypothetical protein [Pontibacter qinzhouensis]TXK37020.1 hypothetical protein FVR03_16205 [Pontibacter qinzhouensis]
MGLKDFFDKAKKEIKVLQGEETKDKVFSNEQDFPDEASAKEAFERAKKKLFDVNLWTDLEGINSTFELYDPRGRKTTEPQPQVGYFVRIILPGTELENWVDVSSVKEEENMAEFTVHPSEKPQTLTDNDEVTEHFFTDEASSTFRVVLEGKTLRAYEIGKNERINNQGEEAGDRKIMNTMIAEGGWAGFQDLQWEKLTRYLVHLEEADH